MFRKRSRSFEDAWVESAALRLAATFLAFAPAYALLFAHRGAEAVAGWLAATIAYAAVMLVLSFSRVTGERWAREFARTFLVMFGPFVWGGVVALVYLFLFAAAGARLAGAATRLLR